MVDQTPNLDRLIELERFDYSPGRGKAQPIYTFNRVD